MKIFNTISYLDNTPFFRYHPIIKKISQGTLFRLTTYLAEYMI